MQQYQKLSELFSQKNSGALTIPSLSPIFCFFTHLEIIGKAGPKILTYKFSFSQDCQHKLLPLSAQKSFAISQYGDTLDIIAIKNNIPFSDLLAFNPSLRSNIDLKEGTIIWLS